LATPLSSGQLSVRSRNARFGWISQGVRDNWIEPKHLIWNQKSSYDPFVSLHIIAFIKMSLMINGYMAIFFSFVGDGAEWTDVN
jgi:hypothetical protein